MSGASADTPSGPRHRGAASTASLAMIEDEIPPPLAAAPDPDAPITPEALLTAAERALLADAERELGCAVALYDRDGRSLLGPAPPAPLLTAQPEGGALELTIGAARYLCTEVFHDGDRLVLVAAGPYGDAAGGAARFLCRLAEQLLYGALQRTMAARMHLASVQDAYCDLQLKHQRLTQALQRMQELDRVKANFLATISHELRTPLTSVIGYSEMLMEGLAGPLNDQQREYLTTVLQKGEQLLGLITGLLSISRIEAAGVRLARAPLDLSEVLRDVGRTVAPHARRKNLELTLSLPETPLRMVGDRDKLRQVILNLVSNAIKFTPERGAVRVHGDALGDGEIRLCVSDTGIGIPDDLRERIFEPFFQVDNTSTREHEGTGLGLSIVRKFVDAHGGRVWVAETGAHGTTFIVALPREAPASPPLPSAQGGHSGQSARHSTQSARGSAQSQPAPAQMPERDRERSS